MKLQHLSALGVLLYCMGISPPCINQTAEQPNIHHVFRPPALKIAHSSHTASTV